MCKPYHMRILILFLFLFCTTSHLHAQEDSLKAILYEGIALHDKGDYEAALKLYDEVIARNPSYLLAWYEKSLTLYTAQRYKECVDLCKEVIKKFREGDELDNIYVNYGSALDASGRPDEAVRVYSQGIRKYNHYLLFFNRGITEYQQKKMEDAIADFKQTLELKPLHASSHQYLGYSVYGTNKIAGMMCLVSFLLIEPNTERSDKNLKLLYGLLESYAKKQEDNVISITMSRDMFKMKSKPDHFASQETLLALESTLELSDSLKGLPAADKLRKKLEIFAGIGDERKAFFSNFYGPFFRSMKENNWLETASHLILSRNNDEITNNWLSLNQEKVKQFQQWLQDYQWLDKSRL